MFKSTIVAVMVCFVISFTMYSVNAYAKGVHDKGIPVRVVNKADNPVPVTQINVQYECKVFKIFSGNSDEAMENYQTELNTYASDGWEFVSFTYQELNWTTQPVYYVYVGVMRRPIQ